MLKSLFSIQKHFFQNPCKKSVTNLFLFRLNWAEKVILAKYFMIAAVKNKSKSQSSEIIYNHTIL
ncbi:hypothetical protein BLX91_20435 [Bacillus subtilis]|nr:hypothetical protein BLX91_20435 [Bacillus subtilis]